MLHLSLRFLAVLLCVAAAVAIGALTLSVSVTRAMTALRAMGDRHAMALADVLRWELEHFFELPSVSLDIMKNSTRVDHGEWPSSSQLQTRRYLDQAVLHQFLMPNCLGVNFLFYDGIRVFGSLIGDVGGSRFGAGLFITVERYFRSEGFSADRWYYDSGLRLLPPSDKAYRQPIQRVDAAEYLALSWAATRNGTLSGWLPEPVVAAVLGVTQTFDMLVGAFRNRNNVVVAFGGPYLYMNQFHRYLHNAALPTGSYAFVVDNTNGCIFSSSYPLSFETLTLVPASTKPGRGCVLAQNPAVVDVDVVNPRTSNGSTYLYCRTPALQYAYPPLQALMDDASFSQALSLVTTFISSGSDNYFAASAPIRARYPNVYLQLIVTMPETVVVGDLASQIGIAIGFSVLVTVFFAVLVMIVVAMLLQPVVDIAMQLDRSDPMEGLPDGGDHQQLRELCWLSEVRSVQLAHRAMRSELDRVRAFIPYNLQEEERKVLLSDSRDLGCAEPECDADTDATPATTLDDLVDLQIDRSSNPLTRACDDAASLSEQSNGGATPESETVSHSTRRVRFAARARTLNVLPVMSMRDVAVMAANVNGFHRVCERAANESGLGRGAAIADVVRALVHQVRRAALRHGGAIESFNGDQVIVSFNANVFRRFAEPSRATDRPSACRAALGAALDVVHGAESVDATSNDDKPAPLNPLHWRVGVAHCTAVVGLAGTEAATAAHIIGSAWTHAATLEQLGKVHRVRGVLVSDRFLAAANTGGLGVEWRVVGSHMLPGRVNGRESAVIAARRRRGRPNTLSLPHQARAVKMCNAQRVLTVEGRAEEAAQVTRALTALLGGEAERDAWELREALRWSDVPVLERLHDELHLRGVTINSDLVLFELKALLSLL